MSDRSSSRALWLTRLIEHLKNERYASDTVNNCVAVSRRFLVFVEKRHIKLRSVQPIHVEKFLEDSLQRFRRRYGHLPASRNWRSARTAPVRMLLRLAQGQWPPSPKPATQGERFQHQICEKYVRWMVDIRGLAPATVSARRKEAGHFLRWLGKQASRTGIAALTVADVDRYVMGRSSSLRRSSIKMLNVWLRIFLRWLHATGQTNHDLSKSVVGPSTYAFASVPSALRSQDVKKILDAAQRDGTVQGIRDYAILMLLSKYGMRAGEVAALRLDDIDWRKEIVRVRHTKTAASSCLPLLPEVGNAILKYLQKARPRVAFRQIFIRTYAPYRPFEKGASIYTIVRSRIDAAGVVTSGKRGPHAFRHARAVSMLRAKVSLKEIGDVLGHRSTTSTMTYLKLATEDLRMIALDIPVEVQA
jgi:integrase/recombinase XerD